MNLERSSIILPGPFYTLVLPCVLIYTFCRNAIGTYLNDKMRYTGGTAVLHVALLKTTHRKSKQTKCEGT